MSDGKVQLALRELQDLARSVPLWLTFAAIVLLFTVTGPYGTAQSMPLIPRFAFWLILHSGAWLASIIGVVAGLVLLEGLISKKIIRIFVGALLATPAVGFVITLVNWGWNHSALSWAEFGKQTQDALPLSVVFSGICFLVMRGSKDVPLSMGNQPEAPARSSLLDRLKPENRGTILYLSAEDHYTAVTTSRAQELVLIRFSDALSELEAEDGLQVHRSHWVAKSHVDKLARDNGKLTLILKDGREVPVSRTFSSTVRENWR